MCASLPLFLGVNQGDTTSPINLVASPCAFGNGTGGGESLFVFTVPSQPGDHELLLDVTTSGDVVLSARGPLADASQGCTASPGATCIDEEGLGGGEHLAFPVNDGDTYVIVVDSWDEDTEAPFTLTAALRAILPRDAPCDPAGLVDRCADPDVCTAVSPSEHRCVPPGILLACNEAPTMTGANPFTGTFATDETLTACGAGADAIVHHAPQAPVDLFIESTHPFVTRAACDDAETESACLESPAELRNVTAPITFILSRLADETSFTLTLRERPILAAGQPCDLSSYANRCQDGLICRTAQPAGSDFCVAPSPPTLSTFVFNTMDLDGSGVADALRYRIAASDPDNDVLYLELTTLDAHGNELSLRSATYEYAPNFVAPLNALFLYGDIPLSDLVNADALASARGVLVDQTGLRSQVKIAAATSLPVVTEGAACDISGATNACAQATRCDYDIETCVNPERSVCDKAVRLEADVPADVVAQPMVRFTYVVQNALADVSVEVSPSLPLEIREDCANPYVVLASGEGHVELRNIAADNELGVIVFDAMSTATITVTERTVLFAGSDCSLANSRCADNLTCRDDGEGTLRCFEPGPPQLTAAEAALSSALHLRLTATDPDGDLAHVRITFLNANNAAIPLTSGIFLRHAFAETLTIPLTDDVSAARSVDLQLEDARGLLSNPPLRVPLQSACDGGFCD